ncbi:GH39 family glycosyl hydrolase [Acrocarpospora catenulata]|uniref:GH39 family glycosyl hydrolase n=1 Tax=Acrocarpospora catenulata TaxID=2836182 RepID=UPI001BD92CC7|nr:glycosyl hydrolase [Acrocarpospora catenulata]
MSTAESARRDWLNRVYRPSGEVAGAPVPALPAPGGLRAWSGRGHATLTWDPVPGAIGYLVERAAAQAGPYQGIGQPDVDVPAVPGTRYVDTGDPAAWYRVAAITTMDSAGPFCEPVPVTPGDTSGQVTVEVRADRVSGAAGRPWAYMIGSEHLSHLLSTDTVGGRPIGEELLTALRLVREELGVRTVRAHAILGDDLGVYREVDGEPVHDFRKVEEVYDRIMSIGLRPIVELSFMPRDLAADPARTVFGYQAIISPPRDYDRWGDLVRALTQHLADRYGLQELIDNWAFEVWNEPNLEVFWSGTPEEFFRLYDVTAAAVKDVHPGLRVGGPSSAANGWVQELLDHVDKSGAPLDFLSTHTYGNAPLDWRPALARHDRTGTPIWWTEWGPTPTHFHGIGDGPFGATFLLHGMRSAAGRLDALSHWVASDHFEELGRPPALFHGGFGLLTVGNLRKPRYFALSLANRLGPHELHHTLTGDLAALEIWPTRHPDGTLSLLIWNTTLNQSQAGGVPTLTRDITLTLTGLTPPYTLTHHRIDHTHSNIQSTWAADTPWPDGDQWAELHAANTLDLYTPPQTIEGETVTLTFPLPMPGVSYIELTPR